MEKDHNSGPEAELVSINIQGRTELKRHAN